MNDPQPNPPPQAPVGRDGPAWEHRTTRACLQALGSEVADRHIAANAWGHHPYGVGDLVDAWRALDAGEPLTVRGRRALALALLAARRRWGPEPWQELIDAQQAGQLHQGADGLMHVVDHYDLPPYV